jgi:hypothetical protein
MQPGQVSGILDTRGIASIQSPDGGLTLSDAKRGSRDISELKQRLGLKGKPPAGQKAGGQAAGIAPPPGLNVAPPAPAQPVIPNAADDPFGAMNAMAAVGTVQRAPEIVIVNDGKPVENVGSSSLNAKIAMIAIPGVLMLVVGIALGKIGTGASHYNDGLSGAKELLENEKELKKALSDLERVLDGHKAKSNYKPDPTVDKDLGGIAAKLEVKPGVYARARNITLEGDVAAQALAFYGGIQEIKAMLDTHLKSAKSDDQAYLAAKKAGEEKQTNPNNSYLTGQWRYAIVVTAPTTCGEGDKGKDCELPFGAQFVEIGPPVCDGKVATSGKCPDGPPTGHAYRTDPGNPVFTTGELQTQGADQIPSKKMIPLLDNGVIRGVLQGNDVTASEALYTKRLRTIAERGKKLIQDANKLEPLLQTQANKGTRFTFGM